MKLSNYLATPKNFSFYFKNVVFTLRSFSLVLTLLFNVSVNAQTSYSKVVIFGDSLSDTGNIASSIGSLPYPYYNNRITNGPVAVDEFTDKLGFIANASLHLFGGANGYNYAVAGGKIAGNGPEDLGAQVSAFLNRSNSNVDADALYFLMLGGNDLRNIRGTANAGSAQLQIDSTVAVYIQQIQRLQNAGARFFMVANVPNIGRIPETLALESSTPGIVARAQSYTRYFNQRLNIETKALSLAPNAYIIEFDFYTAFENLISNPVLYGFDYTDVACLDFPLQCDFNRFVFFDSIHPTGKTHQILGEAMYNRLLDVLPGSKSPAIVAPILLLLLGG